MFDSPIFYNDDKIENGWVNVGQYNGYQSFGLCHETREKAISVAGTCIYRIRVKVKDNDGSF